VFRCQMCDCIVPQGIRAHKLVVKTRQKNYAPRGTKPVERRNWRQRGRVKRRQVYDKGGEGTEIVRELAICPDCATKHQMEQEANTSEDAE